MDSEASPCSINRLLSTIPNPVVGQESIVTEKSETLYIYKQGLTSQNLKVSSSRSSVSSIMAETPLQVLIVRDFFHLWLSNSESDV